MKIGSLYSIILHTLILINIMAKINPIAELKKLLTPMQNQQYNVFFDKCQNLGYDWSIIKELGVDGLMSMHNFVHHEAVAFNVRIKQVAALEDNQYVKKDEKEEKEDDENDYTENNNNNQNNNTSLRKIRNKNKTKGTATKLSKKEPSIESSNCPKKFTNKVCYIYNTMQ